MQQTSQFIVLPPTYAEKVRSMEVGQSFEIKAKERQNLYTRARMAFPEAKFKTREHDGKIYLTRVA